MTRKRMQTNEEVVALAIRIPRTLHERLRKLAYDENMSINKMAVDGLYWIVGAFSVADTITPDRDVRPAEVIELLCSDAPAGWEDAAHRRDLASQWLSAMEALNPHYRGVKMNTRRFLVEMKEIRRRVSQAQLDYIIGVCSKYVSLQDFEESRYARIQAKEA